MTYTPGAELKFNFFGSSYMEERECDTMLSGKAVFLYTVVTHPELWAEDGLKVMRKTIYA